VGTGRVHQRVPPPHVVMWCRGFAGYACPFGSYSATAVDCSAGLYSEAGAGECSLCPAGRYGESDFVASRNCSGPCLPGKPSPAACVGG
jgi:hypothetical protein